MSSMSVVCFKRIDEFSFKKGLMKLFCILIQFSKRSFVSCYLFCFSVFSIALKLIAHWPEVFALHWCNFWHLDCLSTSQIWYLSRSYAEIKSQNSRLSLIKISLMSKKFSEKNPHQDSNRNILMLMVTFYKEIYNMLKF